MSVVHFGNALRGGPECPLCRRYCMEHACPTCSAYGCGGHARQAPAQARDTNPIAMLAAEASTVVEALGTGANVAQLIDIHNEEARKELTAHQERLRRYEEAEERRAARPIRVWWSGPVHVSDRDGSVHLEGSFSDVPGTTRATHGLRDGQPFLGDHETVYSLQATEHPVRCWVERGDAFLDARVEAGIDTAVRRAHQEEREACAQLAERHHGLKIAATIRSRLSDDEALEEPCRAPESSEPT